MAIKKNKKILNILYQSNDNYAPITGVSMTSLFENNRNIDEINIYLLNDNISKDNINKFEKSCKKYKRNLILLDTSKILCKLKDELHVSPFKGTYTTYFKLMIINDLKLPSDRILQLDGDTVINGTLEELCDMNISDCILAATYDCTMNSYKNLIDIPLNDKYYNGGVLLINQEKWIKENCEDQIVNHLKNVRNWYYTVDQDILNVLFRKQFKYLNISYNFNSGFYIYGIKESLKMYDLKDEYYDNVKTIEKAYKNPKVYHCMGAMTGRPWEENSIHPQNEIYRKYMAISEWKDTPLKVVKRTKIFRIQRFLYLHLPRNIYILFHKIGQRGYLNKKNAEIKKISNNK